MQPGDVFTPNIAAHVDDTGDCWLWTGAYVTRGNGERFPMKGDLAIRTAALGEAHAGVRVVPVCEDQMCVHPDHLSYNMSPEGRLMFIREKSYAQGECRIWTGKLDYRSAPQVVIQTRPKQLTMYTQRYVYEQEHGVKLRPGTFVIMSCGNGLCVSHKHMWLKQRPSDGRCLEGHVLPPDTIEYCPTCQKISASRCSRGHVLTGWETTHGGRVACDCCRRDDAREFIRQRNAETLRAGVL